jgi:hypothetical protein
MTEQTASPPGWYPDNTGRLQWWDGLRWTGAYADEQPQPLTGSDRRRSLLATLVGLAQLIVLTGAQLTWLGRLDQSEELLGLMIGPFVGVIVGSAIGLSFKRRKRPRPRPLMWHVVLSVVVSVGWLLLLAGTTGGITTDVILPTVVLGFLGAAAMTLAIKVITPDLVKS